MKLTDLSQDLDVYFHVKELETDPAMNRFVPRVYSSIQFDYTRLFEDDFCKYFNGLMLRANNEVSNVFCISFPTPDVLRKILAGASGNDLIFTHHPIDMAVAGAGFLPISPEDLSSLRLKGVSMYSCHAPLDCHTEVSTNVAIVQALRGRIVKEFLPYGNGFAGRIAIINGITPSELLGKGRKIFGVSRAEQKEGHFRTIEKIAIVAGGGDDVDAMAEAESLGAEAYITGEWYTRSVPLDPRDQEWAQENRTACQNFAKNTRMHLFGFSHPATEFLVMKTQMEHHFHMLGLEAVAVPQDDWWR